MKNENNNLSLEQLLADLEHGGRDARRQQALGDMIDRMAEAGDGCRRHGAWWWTARLAAAACVVFFVVTAVRIWFIPVGGSTLVAENTVVPVDAGREAVQMPDVPEVHSVVSPVSVLREKHAAPPAVQPQPATELEMPMAEKPVVEEPVETLTYVAEEVVEAEDTVAPDMVAPSDVVAPAPLAVADEPTATPQAETPREAPRRSLFASLFRRAAPSHMDGTMLAFNLL